jgi:hypothetical protein
MEKPHRGDSYGPADASSVRAELRDDLVIEFAHCVAVVSIMIGALLAYAAVADTAVGVLSR